MAALVLAPALQGGSSAASAAASEPTPAAAAAVTIDDQAKALLAPPVLVNPLVRTLQPTTPGITLDPTRDYVVKVKAGSVFRTGVTILGGHNVVFENATLQYDPLLAASLDTKARGLMLSSQTGVMWINGLQIRGPLKEGIQMEQKAPGAAVVLQNIAIDPLVGGSYEGWHSDLLQTWAGPAKLVVDNFTGSSDYQGFFLKPNQLAPTLPKPDFFWLRNVTLDVSHGYYALWTDGYGAFPVQTTNVGIKAKSSNRDQWLYPKPSTGDTTWSSVSAIG